MLRRRILALVACWLAMVCSASLNAQSSQRSADPSSNGQSTDASSKNSKIDLSPPKGDAADHPDSDVSDVTGEMHNWDPHKSDKSVEVAEYHMRNRNYASAESRYREALDYQGNNARALYGLGDVLEREKKNDEAVKEYTQYLKVLPHGPKANDARAALERLKAPVPEGTGTLTPESDSKTKGKNKGAKSS